MLLGSLSSVRLTVRSPAPSSLSLTLTAIPEGAIGPFSEGDEKAARGEADD
jgi:hypothetical protein